VTHRSHGRDVPLDVRPRAHETRRNISTQTIVARMLHDAMAPKNRGLHSDSHNSMCATHAQMSRV